MSYALTTKRGTPAWSTSSPKFGTHSLSAPVLQNAPVDSFLSSTGLNGGNLTTGTIEGWVKTTDGSTRVWASHDNWFWIGMVSGKAEAHYGLSASEVSLTSTATINDGSWHHVALVFSAGAASLYVDGNRVATSATTKATGTSTELAFLLGGLGGSSTYDWVGNIDEVRISTTARYTGSTYTTPVAAFTPDASTRAIYHLDNNGSDSNTVTIAANDTNVVYSPYNWKAGTTAETINSGAYLKALIDGASAIDLTFDMTSVSSPVPQISYRVDQGPWTSVAVAATVTLTMPSGNAWTAHEVEVVVKSTSETVSRWSTRNASVKFTGFVCPGGAATRAVQSRTLKLLVYGDSITEGVRTLNSTATNDTDRNDALVGWAWRLAENLGAEVGCVGFGGQGVSVTGSGSVPVLGSAYDLLWSGEARSFTDEPDVVIVNIGANDGSTNITTAMTTFLDDLLTDCPTAKVLVMRPFNGNRAANLQSAVAACSDPSRVYYIDTTGWWSTADSSDSLHPYGYVNVAVLSPLLAAEVRRVLEYGSLFVNSGGVAQPASVRV